MLRADYLGNRHADGHTSINQLAFARCHSNPTRLCASRIRTSQPSHTAHTVTRHTVTPLHTPAIASGARATSQARPTVKLVRCPVARHAPHHPSPPNPCSAHPRPTPPSTHASHAHLASEGATNSPATCHRSLEPVELSKHGLPHGGREGPRATGRAAFAPSPAIAAAGGARGAAVPQRAGSRRAQAARRRSGQPARAHRSRPAGGTEQRRGRRTAAS